MKKNIYIVASLLLTVALLTACSNNHSSDSANAEENTNSLEEDTDLNEPAAEENENPYKVVIDPGHGGKDNGASGADGHYEKEFTLDLGIKVQDLLEQDPDIKVLMTRDDDSFISQEDRERPNYANREDADVFISLHQDSFEDSSVSGTESFYYDEESQAFAETMQKQVTSATGFNDRGTNQKSLFVLRDTDMPAVLIEIGYLTNPTDQEKMHTDDFQEQIAESIVEGIKEYLDS